jgi:hypothetical protein
MTREVPAADHQSKLLGTLTVTALKHLGESTLVVDEDNALAPDWRMALIGDIALLGKPADSRSPKRIDCYQVTEHGADGAAFKLDPARVVFSLRWKHNAEPPDFKLVRLREDPELWERWANGANLTLLAELRRRAPHAVDWSCRCSTPSKRPWRARLRGDIDRRCLRTLRSKAMALIWAVAPSLGGARTAATSRRINARADSSPFAHARTTKNCFRHSSGCAGFFVGNLIPHADTRLDRLDRQPWRPVSITV